MTGAAGTPTKRLANAVFDIERGDLDSLLAAVRAIHPSAKVFRLVRRSKPTLTTLERAVVEAADHLAGCLASQDALDHDQRVEKILAESDVEHALADLRSCVNALRAKRGG